ncbi:class 1 fructose-bisphosphatase [Halohasta litorea]|uniref:Fructose-1,6-bisphosphatase class 1 n=1 Tax=Halohasta litorea TaxID=869891 RepID=A0ABD6DBY2_9EURY|nr:class 1 fructose-bisphosphatase [Halohasta litorea]
MGPPTDHRQDTRPEVTGLIEALIESIPEIKSVLAAERGASGKVNPSGDTQRVADEQIDEIVFDCVNSLDGIGQYVSEEREGITDLGSGLSVATDPLDGSSNIKTNTTVGTIIGVYDAELPARGRELVASLCLVLGPVPTLGVAADDELIEYTIQDGAIVGSRAVRLPESGGIWSFSGQPTEWTPALRSYEETLGQQYAHRYTGAMIADVWLLLAFGGLVGYPERSTKPDGVLRLLYESNPVAYALECAGGAASTGSQPILDVEPEGLHQRIPTFFGTQSLIDELETRLDSDIEA